MKYIITESQKDKVLDHVSGILLVKDAKTTNESEKKIMKKFDRSKPQNKGKFGEVIEKIALDYLSENPGQVCDVVSIVANKEVKSYYLLILLAYGDVDSNKLEEYVKNLIPIKSLLVITKTEYGCND